MVTTGSITEITGAPRDRGPRCFRVLSGPVPLPSLRRVPRALTDGGDEGGVEGVLAEAEQQTRLPHAAVSDQQQLEQVVVGLRHGPARAGALLARWFRLGSAEPGSGGKQETMRGQATHNALRQQHPAWTFKIKHLPETAHKCQAFV